MTDSFHDKITAAFSAADEKHLALARLFHLAAFQNRPEKLESLEENFKPAPVYLFQALALSFNEELREKVLDALS